MKPYLIFITLLALLMVGVVSAVPIQTTTEPTPGQTLVYLPLAGPEAETRLPEGVTLFARVNGRSGPALLIGADPAALAAAGIPAQALEPIPAQADYYLVYPRPGQAALEGTAVGQTLLVEEGWRLVRTDPAAAETLAAQGWQLQRITLDPKPWLGETAVVHVPAVVEPDPLVQNMVAGIHSDTLYQYTGNLSGEWPVAIGGAPYTILTRHTYSGVPIQKATLFVGEHFANLGLAVEYHQWGGAAYPNVIGEIPGLGNPETIYILSAHLDNMPSGPLAPGADDNASGVVAALIAADILSQYQWDCTLRFGLWTGEEQGLHGSAAYAQRAYNQGENIAGALNLDMIAWSSTGSSPDIELHATSSLPATLAQAQLFASVIDAYDLDLVPNIIPNGIGASDHASFWQYGYPAILGIERYNGDFNPYYHTVNDRLSILNMAYFTEFVRASLATFVHLSGCLITEAEGGLEGWVTDGGDGISGAALLLEHESGQTFSASSDATGYYTQTLPVGTYTMTVQASGYALVTLTGIVVNADEVTTQNVELTPLVACEPVTEVQVAQAISGTLYAGDMATLAVTLWPETAVPPFTYTLSISGTEVLTGQVASGVSFLIEHPLMESGVYPVTVAVWSCDLTAPVNGDLWVTVLPATERYKLYLPLIVGP
jgi:hypothetical protein